MQAQLQHVGAGNPTLVLKANSTQQQLLKQGQSVQLSAGDAFALVATRPNDTIRLVSEGDDAPEVLQHQQDQPQQPPQQEQQHATVHAAAATAGAQPGTSDSQAASQQQHSSTGVKRVRV